MQEFFGIDVGGTAVKWAVLGEDFSIRERGSLPTGFTTAEETVSALIGLVEPYRERVSAVGVSAPGGIYEGDVTGTIHRGGALTFMDGCPLGKLMCEALGVPVAVNNDGKCCALGEYAAGALRGTRFGVVLAIGTGIGGGIVIDGKVRAARTALQASSASCATMSQLPRAWKTPLRVRAVGVRSVIPSLPRRACLRILRWTAAASLSGSRMATWRRSAHSTATLAHLTDSLSTCRPCSTPRSL